MMEKTSDDRVFSVIAERPGARFLFRHGMQAIGSTRWMAGALMALLASCAAPKAVVQPEPSRGPSSASAGNPASTMPAQPWLQEPQDDIRLPENFLAMPGDDQFKSGKPTTASPGAGEIKVRPPLEPVPPTHPDPR